MSRSKRHWTSQEAGSVHIISRVVGKQFLLGKTEKEYFLQLLERLSSGFFVQIHAFVIMSNHFHIVATGLEKDAASASEEDLLRRYKIICPKTSGPPQGTYDSCGQFFPDVDGGILRLRQRLGSISRFVQTLKQTFSRWYNKRHDRKGYLWGDRFKGVILSKGEAQLTCCAYIDLNPIRANIVEIPEDYRWSSLGLRVRNPKRARKLLHPLSLLPINNKTNSSLNRTYFSLAPIIQNPKSKDDFSLYRKFVYLTGGVKRADSKSIDQGLVACVIAYNGKLGIGDRFHYRVKNISEGLAFGNQEFVFQLQERLMRKYLRPRSFMDTEANNGWSFSTRVLRS
jgi:REP-associated tyrosine transposase